VFDRSISAVRPVVVSTSAWFAFGKSAMVKSRPAARAAFGQARRDMAIATAVDPERRDAKAPDPREWIDSPGLGREDLRVDRSVRQLGRALTLACEILVEVVLVGRHGRS
jgi:hypothetical protein